MATRTISRLVWSSLACLTLIALGGERGARAARVPHLLVHHQQPRVSADPLSIRRPTRVDEVARRLVDASDVVVRGRVASTTASAAGPSGEPGIFTRVEIDVEENLRGPADRRVGFWVHGGELGNRRRVLSGQARFEPGEAVVVFLRARPDGALFPTWMQLGKWRFDAAREGLIPAADSVLGEGVLRLPDLRASLGNARRAY